MKPAPIAALIVIVVLALSGCSGPERKITATVGPTVTPGPTVEPTATPAPLIVHPTVTVSGDTVVVRGDKDGLARGFRLGEGVYVVSWSGSGTQLSFSLTDLNGNGPPDLSKGKASGKRLLVVDGTSVYAGEFTLMAASDSAWQVTIERPDISSPSSLPVTASGSEADGAVTAPFRAHGGNMKISYSFSRTPYDSGSVNVYDVLTGRSFYTRPMTGGAQVGQSNAEVPYDGIYIAQIIIAPGGAYGDITISQ